MTDRSTSLPHSATRTVRYGASPQEATHAVILLHGRGGGPHSITIPFLTSLLTPTTESKLCVFAPAAEDRTWYPNRYSVDWLENEPYLNGAIERVEREVQQLESYGITRDKIIIGGFSQGACVIAKYIMTYPAKYWGIFILSGALPGLFNYFVNSVANVEQFSGVDLRGTRVLVGCGDSDRLIKSTAADWTAVVISKTGALVDKRIYEGLGHRICDDEKSVLTSWVEELNI
jgi:phospholipase/carboxylesterase